LHLPPLRERKKEIPRLVDFFIQEFARENMKDVRGITPEALAELTAWQRPGNIRELRNCIEKMVVLSSGELLDVADLPEFKTALPAKSAVHPDPLNLENSEKELIRKALAECGNNRAAAARKLGISRRTLYRKLDEMEKTGNENSEL
jgi:DNA-binding NtrC family response regulator